MSINILVIGSGGREHALIWKLAQSPLVETVYAVPGNAGTYREPKVENVALDPLNFSELIEFAKNKQISFTIVGPEIPLVAGIVDYFKDHNLLCLGPTKAAAQLEGSKVFAKSFMERHDIPTANARTFNNAEQAHHYLKQCTFPTVIKADGLASGKGVVIAQTLLEAQAAIEVIFTYKRFGDAGNQIVIEEFLEGQEVSFIALCNKQEFIPLATSQDHKARDDGDVGPNTGGMGAYSPVPFVSEALQDDIIETILKPTLKGMQIEGNPFQGFLYIGLMITNTGTPKVLEYNCRFGDPETQPVLMRLQSDFAQLCLAALQEGELEGYAPLQWDPRPALGVVLAARGYPEQDPQIQSISTLSHLNDIPTSDTYKIFYGSTHLEDGKIMTPGGRALCVTALGETLEEAQEKAYRIVRKINWEGGFYRNDIGHRALSKKPEIS